MTIIVWTVVFAAAMIVFTKVPVAIAMQKQFGRYDNKTPREQESNLTGFGKRAMSAHENSIENFPVIAAGALLAAIDDPGHSYIPIYCSLIIAARLLYWLFYLVNLDKLRSVAWAIAFASSIGLMLTAI